MKITGSDCLRDDLNFNFEIHQRDGLQIPFVRLAGRPRPEKTAHDSGAGFLSELSNGLPTSSMRSELQSRQQLLRILEVRCARRRLEPAVNRLEQGARFLVAPLVVP